MKNPLLDAIKQMKAKRVAIMVGDADELGLPDMQMGMGDEQGEEMEMDSSDEESSEDESFEQTGSEVPDDSLETSETEEIPDASGAEKMMGRKPFDKKKPAGQSAGSDDDSGGIPDAVAEELYDEDMVNRMKSGGKKPNGLMARAQMNLSKRFGK